MYRFGLTALLFVFSAPTYANPLADLSAGHPVCFEREYSDKHMAAHPLQTVKKMEMKASIVPELAGDEFIFLDIRALIKRPVGRGFQYKVYSNGMGCGLKDNRLECGIDCDGGTATVAWDVTADEDQIWFRNKGFVMYGGCGSDVDMDDMIWLDPKKGGDDIFRLYRMNDKSCRALQIVER